MHKMTNLRKRYNKFKKMDELKGLNVKELGFWYIMEIALIYLFRSVSGYTIIGDFIFLISLIFPTYIIKQASGIIVKSHLECWKIYLQHEKDYQYIETYVGPDDCPLVLMVEDNIPPNYRMMNSVYILYNIFWSIIIAMIFMSLIELIIA